MATVKRCFVICPIGSEGSEVRQNADDLFDLLIEPALEVFGFAVTRADKIVGAGQIGEEVIELVQNAELCIVDLTGHNPNVFYECGRRHETARPFIQLVHRGESLPFDLAGVRTLEYDLENSRSTRKRIQEIRKYVEALEESGYGSSSSGVSTTTLAQAIDRVERKIDRINTTGYGGGVQAEGSSSSIPVGVGLEGLLRNPNDAFTTAVATGDIDRAAIAFQQIRRISNDPQRIIAFGGLLASQGRREGSAALTDLLTGDAALSLSDDVFSAAVSALVRFYAVTDTEVEGISQISAIVRPRLESEADPSFKARLYNLVQMIFWGAKQYDDALENGLEAIKLDPDDASYKYNVSMIYEAKGMLEEAEALVDEYMAGGTEDDPDHLSQAIDIYQAVGRLDDVRSCFEKLRGIDSTKASVKIMFDEDLRNSMNAKGNQ